MEPQEKRRFKTLLYEQFARMGKALASPLPQARSLPVTELEARIAELPKEREIVAYCRGPYCVFADEAVSLLRAHGYTARRLEEGVPEWRQLGLPVMR